MPSKNALKDYVAGGYYHLYNRGVNKRAIFKSQLDYSTFLSYLQFYLSPINNLQGEFSQGNFPIAPSRLLKNYAKEIELVSYCLMPNHFHLMVRQITDHGIDHFMRSLCTKYVRYFNSHYNRIGPLFQGPYKAVQVVRETQFLYLTKYIHRNPLDFQKFQNSNQPLSDYKYSSYSNYLHTFSQPWVHPENILSYFAQTNPSRAYRDFVEESDSADITPITNLMLDSE